MISVLETYDFSKSYSVDNVRWLIEEYASEGFTDYGIIAATDFIMQDYQNKRANVFGYLNRKMDARTLMELRKTMILNLPSLDYGWFGDSTDSGAVVQHRIHALEPKLAEYEDENWQYDWAVHIFIPKEKRGWLEYAFEDLLVDGNLERDRWVDPLHNLYFKLPSPSGRCFE